MSSRRAVAAPARGASGPGAANRLVERVLAGLRQLVDGLGTALPALVVLTGVVAVTVLCLVGVGLLLVPLALRAVRGTADLERSRLGRWGPEVSSPGPAPVRLPAAVGDRAVLRELAWLACHATGGLLLGMLALLLPIVALRDLTFPLYWWALPDEPTSTSLGWGVARGWADVVAPVVLSLVWLALIVGLIPVLARLQALPGRRLLVPGKEADLSLRVAELTATRAAALDAHATELRRIERSLHDGTQNRLVAVTVLLGAARRALGRDPDGAEALLERAQGAAEQALAELRVVARGILPPVLTDRGLAGALTGLAATCPVPCRVDVDVPGRCPASVEATAYFVVAEALTNTARHSRARAATVTAYRRGQRLHLRVLDDGCGGAAESRGDALSSGLAGIRGRVEALDGVFTLTSPPGGPTILDVELPCGS